MSMLKRMLPSQFSQESPAGPRETCTPMLPPEIALSPANSAEMTALASALAKEQVPLPHALTTRRFQQCRRRIPAPVRDVLERFRAGMIDEGVLLIHGLGVGDIPETPSEYHRDILGLHLTSFLAALIAEQLGILFGYEDEQHGALVQDVYPIPEDKDKVMGSGARFFDLHTENVHQETRPTYLGLLCVRSDPSQAAATLIASMNEIIINLDPLVRDTLRKPLFISRIPLSFVRDLAGPRPEVGPHPVLAPDSAGNDTLRYNMNNTYGITASARQALDELNHLAKAARRYVSIDVGNLLLLDNRRVLHGRAEYSPRYNGRDRWLRRFYVSGRIQSQSKFTAESRIIDKLAYTQNNSMEID